MNIRKFQKIGIVVMALMVGGLFLSSGTSFAASPTDPVVQSPRNNEIEEGAVYFVWSSNDTDGDIVGYSYQLDVLPLTVVDQEVDLVVDPNLDGVTPQKVYELSKSDDPYYFHVRAVDATSNWSNTTHFEINVKSSTVLVDGFDDEDFEHNDIDGLMWTHGSGTGSYCNMSHTNAVRLGDSGYSIQLEYDAPDSGASGENYAEYATSLKYWDFWLGNWAYSDVSAYQVLSFWVKGESGGESFYVRIQDAQPEGDEPQLREGDIGEVLINEVDIVVKETLIPTFLPGGVETYWKRVVIPLSAFHPITEFRPPDPDIHHGPITWSKMNNLKIQFAERLQSGPGMVYIDNIEFLTEYAADDFDAGRTLPTAPNDPQPPYRLVADDGATASVEYVTGAEAYGGSGNSLKVTYDVPLPNPPDDPYPHCGFQYNFPGPTDVSHLNTLSFYAKGTSEGERFNIYLADEDAALEKPVKIVQYITLRGDDWHHVAIPLEDFKIRGVDLTKVTSLDIIFEWEEIDGVAYFDNIEFTNGLFKELSTGPVKVENQKLFVDGLPFQVRGVGYQPTPIDHFPYDPGISGADVIDVYAYTTENQEIWDRDLTLLEDMNCNTIRTWGKVTSEEFLDACQAHGIYVIMGFEVSSSKNYNIYAYDLPDPEPPEPPNPPFIERLENRTNLLDDFKTYVETYKDHPAVLMWAVGNENNYWYGGDMWWDDDDPDWDPADEGLINPSEVIAKRLTMREIYTLIDELARTAYEVEGSDYHPVMHPNGDLYYIGEEHSIGAIEIDSEVVRITDTAMNYVDIWGANVYRGSSFGDLFNELEFRTTKPLLITEYGTDAFATTSFGPPVTGAVDEVEQASHAIGLWNEVIENQDICVGASIMEYSDEWWKYRDPAWSDAVWETNSGTRNTGGAKSPIGHPDQYSNEEYYGIVAIGPDGGDPDGVDDVTTRQVYDDLSARWAKKILVDDFNDGVDPNELGGAIDKIESQPNSVVILSYDEPNKLGATGYAMKIDYDMDDSDPYAHAGFWTRLADEIDPGLDIRMHDVLSFWVKGETGGELFKVSIRGPLDTVPSDPQATETKIHINDYLPQGVSTAWQKVSIPIAAFTRLVDVGISVPPWDVRDNLKLFAILFEKEIGSADIGVIYIEDIAFERKDIPTTLPVDNFDGEIPRFGGIWSVQSASGATIIHGYDATNPYKGTESYYIDYSIDHSVDPDAYCALVIGLNGLDASSYDTLVFYIRGEVGDEKPNIYLTDRDNAAGFVHVEEHTPVTQTWQMVRIPLSKFEKQGVDLSDLYELSFNFEWEEMIGKIYVDEIAFVYYGSAIELTLESLPDLVNFSPILLSGTKEIGSGIFINDLEVVAIDDYEVWSYAFALTQGENVIRVIARNARGNQSEEIVAIVTYDSTLILTTPPAENVRIVNDPAWGYRNDSTINISVANYSLINASHTGYQVELCESEAFDVAYATYNYWHNSDRAVGAEAIAVNVNFDIDVNQFVGIDPDDVWTSLPSGVFARIKAARSGFTPSDPSEVRYASLSPQVLLEAPNSAVLLNDEEDPIIKVEISPHSPRGPDEVIETGYRIDFLLGDKTFASASWDEMYHVYLDYDRVSTGTLAYYIDMRDAVNSGVFTWQDLTLRGVIARVVSIRTGFTPSDPISAGAVGVQNITRLENPGDLLTVSNPAPADFDRVITVIISNYDPVNLGASVPASVKHKKDTRHTGYIIEVCEDDSFDESKTYRYHYTYDFEGDGNADEIREALPGIPLPGETVSNTKIDVNLGPVSHIVGSKPRVRVLSTRDGYAVNYLDLNSEQTLIYNWTKLQNPNGHATVYNKEAGNPVDTRDRVITVEVENYDPSGIINGINRKDTNHTGYRIDVSNSGIFYEGLTHHLYYIYDPDEDGVPDEISSCISESIKIHIDLDECRESLGNPGPPPPGVEYPFVYVRVLAYRPGYDFNYEDLPGTPLTVPYIDRTLLTAPSSATARNEKNGATNNDIDSSMEFKAYATIITPGDIIHDGYQYKVNVVGADGKTYSKIYPITGLEPVGGNILQVNSTADIKELFEGHTNPYEQYSLSELLGIPADQVNDVDSIEIVSTKEGYANSASVAVAPVGLMSFKNSSVSFFPEASGISAEDPVGTTVVTVQLGPYPTDPPTIPPIGYVKYEIEVTDGEETITVYVPADASTTNIDVSGLSGIANHTKNKVYIQARFVKPGYTPGNYTDPPLTVAIGTPPPMINDFTATPAAGAVTLNVDFTSDITGSVNTYTWDFGDLTPNGSGASPSHPYTAVGTYTVTLTVEGDGGSDVMVKENYVKVGDIAVNPGGSIQPTIDSASNGDTIVLLDDTYTENITIDGGSLKKAISLIGQSSDNTIIIGNIVLKDSDSSIKTLSVLYDKGEEFTYDTAPYSVFKMVMVSEAGITAINSQLTVDSCVIMPDPVTFPLGAKYGKGIQIWNLHSSAAIAPTIENNLIVNADAGIYLYCHDSSNAITGVIIDNTLDLNNSGIVMRTHKENPAITYNIITRSQDAIHLSYNSLLSERLANIQDNCFGADESFCMPVSFDNVNDVWCDELQGEVLTLLGDLNGNFDVDPEFVLYYDYPTYQYPADLDYTPQDPYCEDIGYRE